MKILLFKNENLEPVKIFHNPEDVTICNNGTVLINEIDNVSNSYEFVHLQTELITCDSQTELCILLYVEERLTK